MDKDFSYWNTRVIREHVVYHFKNGYVGDEYTFGIYEVYYNENNEPKAWSKNAMRLYFDTPEGLPEVLKQIKSAVTKTVLELENIDGKTGDLIDSGKTLGMFKEEENGKK